MLELARGGAEEELWLRAERQSAGRGRHGREWVSPLGNLYASTVVRLRLGDPPAPTLALVAAMALAEVVLCCLRATEAVAPARPALSIKWPNDLLLGDAKLSGILLERADDAVVIGFGVNLTHAPELPDRKTTSLAAHAIEADPTSFAERLAPAFARRLANWRTEGLAPVREQWLALAHAEGSPLIARLPDGSSAEGFFAGLDANGALLLRLADGVMRVIHAADVFTL